LYHIYRKNNTVKNFQEFLENIFEPLFEATKNPKKHKTISIFLQQLVGFDSVDDESVNS
jgi:AMP deaminase